MEDDIIPEMFHCPRCGSVLKEKRPTADKHLVVDKEKTIRLFCPCGFYKDIVKDNLP